MKVAVGLRYIILTSVIFAFKTFASVEMLHLEDVGFVAKYYSSPNTSSKKPVIVLGGSEGGIPTKLAQAVAEQGYPTLALAYFGIDALPEELNEIPLEYFHGAKSWLLKKHNLTNNEISLVGWSKGAELALLLASRDITFEHIVAVAPSSVVWAGILNDWKKLPGSSWVEENKSIPFVSFNPSGPVDGLLDLYSQSIENRTDNDKADIAVENINGNVFLYSGGKDEIWPSSQMADSICKRMEKNTKSQCVHFHHSELDHLLDYTFLEQSTPLNKHFARSLAGG